MSQLGIYKRWPRREKMSSYYSERHQKALDLIGNLEDLNAYAAGNSLCVFNHISYPEKFGNTIFLAASLSHMVRYYCFGWEASLLKNEDLGEAESACHAYSKLEAELYLYNYHYLINSWGKPLVRGQFLSFDGVMFLLGLMAYWKDLELVSGLHRLLREANEINSIEYMHNNLAYFFMLYLLDDFFEVQTEWPKHDDFKVVYRDLTKSWSADDGFDSIYSELLADWETDDLNLLVSLILPVCDRHTHQARESNSKRGFDFSNQLLYHFPIEVITLFRLREAKGLENPTIDHPLMASPFDALPDGVAEYSDGVIEGVMARIKRDLPNFDEVVEGYYCR